MGAIAGEGVERDVEGAGVVDAVAETGSVSLGSSCMGTSTSKESTSGSGVRAAYG